jgi:hypothetical protein
MKNKKYREFESCFINLRKEYLKCIIAEQKLIIKLDIDMLNLIKDKIKSVEISEKNGYNSYFNTIVNVDLKIQLQKILNEQEIRIAKHKKLLKQMQKEII